MKSVFLLASICDQHVCCIVLWLYDHMRCMTWMCFGAKVESPCESSPCMQWEGQELNTQLFSPNASAQEVPVSPHVSLQH